MMQASIGSRKHKHDLGEPTSGFEKIVDYLQRGNYLSANVAQYLQGQSPYENVGKAALAGLTGKNRLTYSALTGNPWSGLALDIILDPTTWIPFGAPAKVLRLTKIPTLTSRAFIAFTEKVPFLGPKAKMIQTAIMRGFVDPFYRTKILSGAVAAERALSKLNISDDILRAAKAGTLTDDLLKTVNKKALPHLEKVAKYNTFLRNTLNLPHEITETGLRIEHGWKELIEDYAKFEKLNPKKSAALLNAMEYGLASPENGYYGVSRHFVGAMKDLGLTDMDIASIQEKIVRPAITGAKSSQVDMLQGMGKMMDEIPVRPEQWTTGEFQALMDEALKKLDPEVRTVYNKVLEVQHAMMDEGVKRQFILEQTINDFAARKGLAHVRHMPIKGKVQAINKFQKDTSTRLSSGILDQYSQLEKSLKDLGVSDDIINMKVSALRDYVEKISTGDPQTVLAKPDMVVGLQENMRTFLDDVPASGQVRQALGRLEGYVKEINEFRYGQGTIDEINKAAGKKIFETNLATIFMSEEMRLRQAAIYQDYLKKLLDSGMDIVRKIDANKIIDIPKDFSRIDDQLLGSFLVHKDLLKPFKLSVSYAAGKGDDFMELVRGTDKITSVWKYITLIPFAKFHIRNLATEISFNAIAGMNPVLHPSIMKHYNRAMKLWHQAKFGKPSEEYYKMVREGVIMTGFMRTEAAAQTGEIFKKGWLLKKGLGAAEHAGSFTEEMPRIAMYLWAREGGEKLLKKYGAISAADLVSKFHVDYGKITSFESEFMRRLMPFYSWYRFNIPLHVKMIPNAPGFYANVDKTRKAITEAKGGEMPEWWAPEYIREGYAVGWSRKPGKRTYIILRGWYPAADINSILSFKNLKDQFVQMLHPVKFIPEAAWGYDTFRKRKIPAYPGETVKVYGARLPARAAHLLSPIRAIKETNALIFGANTSQNSFWDRVVYSMMGKTYEVDVAKTKKYLKYDMNRMINDIEKGISKAKDNEDYRTVKKLIKAKSRLEAEVKRL